MAAFERLIERLRAGLADLGTRGRRAVTLAFGILVVAVAALGTLALGRAVSGGDGAEGPLPEASGGAGPAERTSFLARLIPPTPERVSGPVLPRSISDLTRRLPLERKVAQLFLVGFRGIDLTAPVFRQLGRVDLGGIVLERRNYLNPQQLGSLAGEARVIAREERHVPPWVLAAQEGGEFSQFPDLPPARPPSRLRTVRAAVATNRRTASTLRSLGVNGVLGPVVDVGLEEGGVDAERSYSDNPRAVAAFARATVRVYSRRRVLSSPKFFPGLGAASQSTDEGPATVGLSTAELARRDLVPFRAAVAARAPAIVVGHAAYAADDFVRPASLSRRITTDLLRGELGFRGVAITDDLAAPAVTTFSSVPDAAVSAFRAGADMVYISGPRADQDAAYLAVLNAARRRRIPRARIDEALLRVLRAKETQGLIR